MKTQFASKIGALAAAAGSAVGLGNIWRFPAEAHSNGGAVFVMMYLICLLLFGIPVMCSEFAMGRGGGGDTATVFTNITPGRKAWRMAGIWPLITAYTILGFYMVVSGWSLEYLVQTLTGDLYAPVAGTDSGSAMFLSKMNKYIATTYRPLVMTLIMIAANAWVLACGVQKGIEKMSKVLMPMLFVILLVFCVVSLMLPGAADGISFFLKPDFSKFTPECLVNALGQCFFSMSLGMGTLITYGSYFPSDTRLARTAGDVAGLDLLVAMLMGVIIFPAVSTFHLTGESLEGQGLVFVTMPEIFSFMPGTMIWSALFFLLLCVAAFTSTISVCEVIVAYFHDHKGMSRIKACIVGLLPLIPICGLCSLSMGLLGHIHIFGYNIFGFLDNLTSNVLLPVGSLMLCIYIGWIAPKKFFSNELTNGGKLRSFLFPCIEFIVKWIAPELILLILLWQFF